MLNDARVASACLYVRTGQRVRNSKNIATIRDFQVHVRVNSTSVANREVKCIISVLLSFRTKKLDDIHVSTSLIQFSIFSIAFC